MPFFGRLFNELKALPKQPAGLLETPNNADQTVNHHRLLLPRLIVRRQSARMTFMLICLGMLGSNSVLSQSLPTQPPTLEQQRKLYTEVQSNLRLKKLSYADIPYNKLINYPLTPYLKFQALNRNLRKIPSTEIDRYFQENSDSWLSERLRINWLKQLAASKRWSEYRQYYTNTVNSNELKCLYLNAEYRSGNKAILSEVGSVWNQGKSLPKACDPLFSVWLKSTYFQPELAWQRHLLAVENRKLALASYIERYIDKDQKALAKQMRELHHYPSRLNKLLSKTGSAPEIEDVIHYGVKRYARHNPKATLALWEKFDAAYLLDSEKRNETVEYLAYRLILDDKSNLANRLLDRNQLVSERISEKQLRKALKNQQWQTVIQLVSRLPQASRDSHRWRYWTLRANEALGNLSSESAQQGYLGLSADRDFYSFLAAERAQMPYELGHRSVQPSDELLNNVGKIPALARSHELFKLGKINQARMEWRFGTRGMDTPSLVAVGSLANDWGWHRKTIESLGKAKFWDDLTLRFPLIYQDEVKQVATATTLAPEYILAVARQESAFAPDARSPAGAMGLMQLMPATANQTAKRMGIPYRKNDLLKPHQNILIGSNYLGQMLSKFNGNRILATAAYNAGPYRVSRWLNPENKRVDFDVWIETIPFKETRRYVQNVLSYSLIYSHLMGEEKKLLNQSEWEELL